MDKAADTHGDTQTVKIAPSEDNTQRKKSKKRERSPASLNSSEPSNKQTAASTSSNNNINISSNNATSLTVNNTLQNSSVPPSSNATNSTQPVKKEKQRPEGWNKIEQQIFFNALRQNGKNFESITQYFNARQKRYKIDDGVSVQRSKEQIRHFYYRTWHKIIKYISIPMLKENQSTPQDQTENILNNNSNGKVSINVSNCSLREMQVKCLIAFNALMNKSHRWNKKSAIKLVELINHGWTTVREKGKITRLRMPICKLSSKSTQNDGEIPNNNLPETLNIHLEPNSESAYCRVHRLAQNPFLKVEVQSLQTVKFLIEFLENKWKNRRNQFIEKFQLENQNYKESKTESDDNEPVNNNNNQTNKKNPSNDLSKLSLNNNCEKIILFPNESHQLTNVDLSEVNNLITTNLEVNQTDEPKSNEENKATENKDSNLICDDPMGIDDCAVDPDNFPTSSKQSSKKTNIPGLNKNCQLNAEQIKNGLTAKSCHITSNGKDLKELTFIQLYLALNKPSAIKLKYDWIIGENNNENNPNSMLISNNAQLTAQSSSSSSSSIQTLSSKQNLQQRFYLDTLASVAASFLNEIQKSKTENSSLNPPSNNPIPPTPTTSTNAQKNPSPALINQTFKSPPKQQVQQSTQSIAFLQPNKSPKQATILPLEQVLQRINEEQTNKTKKLLSDLSSKRRSRQRKPIMVVNTSHPPRTMLPKINLINGQQIFLAPSNVDQPQTDIAPQQNIVFSGPMAAIARKIVNSSSPGPISSESTTPKQQKILNQSVQDEQNQSQSPKILISSIQQSYSNLIPQILNNLIENNQSSNSNEATSSNKNSNENINMSLNDMSLLDLSINNADSLFGSSVIRINLNPSEQSEKATSSNENNKNNPFSQQSLVVNSTSNKPESNELIIVGENSEISGLSSILNSLSSQKANHSGKEINQNHVGIIRSNSNLNSNGMGTGSGFSLTHRRSDLIVEWTDSMNDVSLTGCFLNDLQSPEKQTKNTNLISVLNENSRDSIFLNMDTIMDILPSGLSRYDESSLLNSSNNTMNTIDNIVVKNLQSTSRS